MASNGDGKSKEGILSTLLNNADGGSMALNLIKRFLYQALGIYFPAVILIPYFLFFWSGGSYQIITGYIPDFIDSNQTFSMIIFLIGVFIVGEAINSLTSNITSISPVKLSLKDNLKYLLTRQPMSIWSANNQALSSLRKPNWPVWMNETYFPVSFAIFDRFYLTTLDADKKALAGKIGWVAFYRNLVAVFIILFVLQFITLSSVSVEGKMVSEKITLTSIYSLDGSDIIYLGVLLGLIVAFLRGYRAQINANRNILWNAYRRNELRKTLETRFGDLSLSLGIKDDYKKLAEDYILDCWFLAAENTIRDISGGILNQAELAYRTEHEHVEKQRRSAYRNEAGFLDRKLLEKMNHNRKVDDNQKTITNCREQLLAASRYWHDGEYEMVIDRALTILENLRRLKNPDPLTSDSFDNKNKADRIIKLSAFPNIPIKDYSQKGKKEKEESRSSLFSEQYWKKIKGLYLFMDMFYAEATYQKISKNVVEWGWIYQSNNSHSAGDDNSKGNLAQEYSSYNAPKFSETFDQFYSASSKIKEVIERINLQRTNGDIPNKVKRSELPYKEEKVLFKILDHIYIQFGGYYFLEAEDAAQKLLNYLNSTNENNKNSVRELKGYVKVNIPDLSREFEDSISSGIKVSVKNSTNKTVNAPAIKTVDYQK